MQLVPRYLVNNRINVVSNDAGFTVEYRPVYSRNLKIYRGIDNTIQFRMLNADQKPVTLTGTVMIVVFDEAQNMIIERECVVTDDGSSVATRGMFHVTITETDLLNVKQQYLYYNVYQILNGSNVVTYANRNFESAGIIYLNSSAYPGPKASKEVNTFFNISDYWIANGPSGEAITADPALNGNEALHTIAVYANQYTGNLEIQATLENQITEFTNWATVDTVTFTGTETEPVAVNFNGVFSYVRFKFNLDPNGKVTKILVRN